ncbi:hypothetical protein phytr_12720 [Candidatus Phycorickettsia trachydisci]|uniref:SpoVT-AbrB domain-containing protein n=1 Tax=Candidatus Phycorickettsia trachydisci TaxID=2115978 RepID=A0A2P1PAC2_9RICK|nr:AbrB/MazE/SpoVT family DNA-binding domain-containing protein [Candidatus Phycorickettsia trachydisci]AVP88196.1 hypothetical protein phytr_12720 [Candidatus Phycorickettsia trachydisci]
MKNKVEKTLMRTKLGEGGRVIIPLAFRQNLHLAVGDEVILQMDSNSINITTPYQALQKLQAKVRNNLQSINQNISLVDELVSIRRSEDE